MADNTVNDGPSFEKLDAINDRHAMSRKIQPVQVYTINDIKRVIAELAPEQQIEAIPHTVNATLEHNNELGIKETYTANIVTKSRSKRQTLLDGFDTIKKYQDVIKLYENDTTTVLVNGRTMKPPTLTIQDPRSYIDSLVKHWLGGVRHGLRVCWDLNDGFTYYYSIYEHKLTRTRRVE